MGTVGGAASGSAVVGTGGHPAAVQQRHAQKVGATVGTMLQLGTGVPVGLQLSDALEPVGNELDAKVCLPRPSRPVAAESPRCTTRTCVRAPALAPAPALGRQLHPHPHPHTDRLGGGHRWRLRRFCKQSNTHAAAYQARPAHAAVIQPRHRETARRTLSSTSRDTERQRDRETERLKGW